MNRPIPLPGRKQDGVALLEALLAVVLLAIGLLGTVGLQARSYSALTEAGMRAEATIAAERLLGVMTADAANLTGYRIVATCPSDVKVKPAKPWLELTCKAIPGANVTVTVDTPTVADKPNDVGITISWDQRANGQKNRHVLRAFI